MNYTIFYLKRAIQEYDDAIGWYAEQSERAALNFQKAVAEKTDMLKSVPSIYKRTHKAFREVALNKYPFSVIYTIDSENKMVIISSIFHHSRNPRTKFR